MYQYKYVEVKYNWSFGKFYLDEEHQMIINQEAKEGWRFVACIPKKIVSDGTLSVIDLVFEKSINNN